MKLAFVVNDIHFLMSHRKALVLEAHQQGWEVYILSDASQVPELPKTIRCIRLPIHRSSLGLWSNIRSLISLCSVYRKIKPDVLHHITLKPIVFGTIAARFFASKTQVINAVSGLGYIFTGNQSRLGGVLLTLLRWFQTQNVHYIFQNRVDRGLFQKANIGQQYRLIKGSGVDHKVFLPKAQPKKRPIQILFTGRILKGKGLVELIHATKGLLQKGFDVELKILGKLDPKNPAHLSKKALEEYLIPNKITWSGFSSEIKQALENCHIYCLPSYREGLPKAIVEAMAIGRPIVTTNAPGCDDCVIEGENGFKVPIKDTVRLQEKLTLLVQDESLREKMGKESRKYFEKEFTLEQVVRQHMQLYGNLRIFE
jgi:glycosyltransferase involved in cell wall biosynthesis